MVSFEIFLTAVEVIEPHAMKKCAFLTIENREGWFIDDHLVHEPLRALGWEVDDVVWHAEVDWNAYDMVVIRSPWDYQNSLDQFLTTLKRIESSSAILQNSLETVEWNVNKTYLFDLQSAGVEIVPTLHLKNINGDVVSDAIDQFGGDEIILKPTMGANADDTFRIGRGTDAAELQQICTLFQRKGCFAQPFIESILTEGEFSLMYFDGKLSHAIIKTVGENDFRVQEEHGGGVVPLPNPDSELVAAANRVMGALEETPMYARVDLVRTSQNSFALMELELIEPCLYFRFGEDSARDFAEIIDARF